MCIDEILAYRRQSVYIAGAGVDATCRQPCLSLDALPLDEDADKTTAMALFLFLSQIKRIKRRSRLRTLNFPLSNVRWFKSAQMKHLTPILRARRQHLTRAMLSVAHVQLCTSTSVSSKYLL